MAWKASIEQLAASSAISLCCCLSSSSSSVASFVPPLLLRSAGLRSSPIVELAFYAEDAMSSGVSEERRLGPSWKGEDLEDRVQKTLFLSLDGLMQ